MTPTQNGKTPKPESSTEMNLEPAKASFISVPPQTRTGSVRELHEKVTRHTQEEEKIIMEEVEEEVEEEAEEVAEATMATSTPTTEVIKEKIRVVIKVSKHRSYGPTLLYPHLISQFTQYLLLYTLYRITPDKSHNTFKLECCLTREPSQEISYL